MSNHNVMQVEESKIDDLRDVLTHIKQMQARLTTNDGVLDTITPSLYFARKGLKIIDRISKEAK